jgi:hypothetical protein
MEYSLRDVTPKQKKIIIVPKGEGDSPQGTMI